MKRSCPVFPGRIRAILRGGADATVFTWDIDKTYLATRTETPGDLVRTFLEFAVDKEVVNGTVPLLKGGFGGGDRVEWGLPSILFPPPRCKCGACFSERCFSMACSKTNCPEGSGRPSLSTGAPGFPHKWHTS